jgi:uncharacterized membrane protein
LGEVSRFLLTRGLWLIVLEFTILRLGWTFSVDVDFFVAQVIWAIGAAMVALAGLVYRPRWAIGVAAPAQSAGFHPRGALGRSRTSLDDTAPAGTFAARRRHEALCALPGRALDWGNGGGLRAGPVFKLDPTSRRRWLFGLGALTSAGFIVLRATNLYGDPAPWTAHDGWLATLLSFIDCEKFRRRCSVWR